MRIDLHIAVAPRAVMRDPASAAQKHDPHHYRHHKRRALQIRASKLLNCKRLTSSKSNHHHLRQPRVPGRGSMPDEPVQPPPYSSPLPEDRLTVAHTLPWDLCYDRPSQDAARRVGNLAGRTTGPAESGETASAADNGATDVAPAMHVSQRDIQSCEPVRSKPLVC
ncbi:hypothetical protein PSPO01_02674 [Paraphaeosphaeria sporulosa]